MIRLKKSGKTVEPTRAPDPRYSQFSNEDLYMAFEQAVAGAIAEMEACRSAPDKRAFHLNNCAARLTGALSAVASMEQRLL